MKTCKIRCCLHAHAPYKHWKRSRDNYLCRLHGVVFVLFGVLLEVMQSVHCVLELTKTLVHKWEAYWWEYNSIGKGMQKASPRKDTQRRCPKSSPYGLNGQTTMASVPHFGQKKRAAFIWLGCRPTSLPLPLGTVAKHEDSKLANHK